MLDVAQVHDLLQGGSGIASAQEAAEGAAKGDTSDERADEESPVDAKAKRTTAMEAAFMFGEAYKLTGGQQAFPTKAATYTCDELVKLLEHVSQVRELGNVDTLGADGPQKLMLNGLATALWYARECTDWPSAGAGGELNNSSD